MVASTSHVVLAIDNLSSKEILYQRFVLVKGHLSGFERVPLSPSLITVDTPSFPRQAFPVSTESGEWAAFVQLQPGAQSVTFAFNGEEDSATTVHDVTYVPLLNVPPLHLAIFVAKDSMQRMFCPPEKNISSSHSDIEAAKKKVRMWAYMHQASTAEQMRSNGFDRRTFRLDEALMEDTLSIEDESSTLHATAQVHVVQLKQTLAEIRSSEATWDGSLPSYVVDALVAYGGPFVTFPTRHAKPVVAGFIFDSHSIQQGRSFEDNAMCQMSPDSRLSLCMINSSTLWAWPRFSEEIIACIHDQTRIKRASGSKDSNGLSYDYQTFSEACCVGQAMVLHQLGHTLGLSHRLAGIMRRPTFDQNLQYFGCNKGLMSLQIYAESQWHLADMLELSVHPLFALPTERILHPQGKSRISIIPSTASLKIQSAANFAYICWSKSGYIVHDEDVREKKLDSFKISHADLERDFGPEEKGRTLSLTVVATDGARTTVDNVWKPLIESFVCIPGCDFDVRKRGILGREAQKKWSWAVLLSKQAYGGTLTNAERVEVWSGDWFDGCHVTYADGSRETMGAKIHPNGQKKRIGGHLDSAIKIAAGESITHAAVWNKGRYGNRLVNVKLFKSLDESHVEEGWEEIRPLENEVLIGFFGANEHDDRHCRTIEFGILTIPKGAVLPLSAYSLPELTNTDGRVAPKIVQ